MKNVREILEATGYGMNALTEANPEAWKAFSQFATAAGAESAISVKNKELICIAIAVYSRCEYCIVGHAYNALKAGCTRQEILEAATLATAFGGGPTMAYSSALLVASLDEFEKDFA